MKTKKQIVAIGEMLWDVFPDGPRFGGAPANFACSAAAVGGNEVNVCLVSGVGNDSLGRQALAELQQRQVGVSHVSKLDHPTGQVFVQLNESGQASYEFAANTAWDNLPWSDDLQQVARSADAVCFGTLGQRSEKSQVSIRRFLAATRQDCLRILDINLRPPFWSEEVILASLSLANVLKLNHDELPVLASLLKYQGSEMELLQQVQKRYSLQLVALTRGCEGSLLLDAFGQSSDLPGVPITVEDTVGAGDAFTAALAIGLLMKLSLVDLHTWASDFAAFVCTQAGATPEIPARFDIRNLLDQQTRPTTLFP